ncbi:unnamed protein product, partial [Ectocarpus fasciculatus]
MTPRGQMSGGANQRPPLSDLPLHLKAMFEPNLPIKPARALVKKSMPAYSGIAAYTKNFELEQPEPEAPQAPPAEAKSKRKEEMARLNEERVEALAADWNPKANREATENAYTTLFVGRLSYDTTEKKLRREFEQYGPVKSIKMVTEQGSGRPRGYAFVEFESEKDMHVAYKRADGNKIDDRRIVVDVERGRTVENWKPRRLGGGLGGRKAKRSMKQIQEDEKKAREAFMNGGSRGPPPPSFRDRGPDRDRGPSGARGSSREEPRRPDRSGVGHSGGSSIYGPPPGSSRPDRDRAAGDRDRDRERERDLRRRSRSPRGDGAGARRRGPSRSRERDRERDREREGSRRKRSRSPPR